MIDAGKKAAETLRSAGDFPVCIQFTGVGNLPARYETISETVEGGKKW